MSVPRIRTVGASSCGQGGLYGSASTKDHAGFVAHGRGRQQRVLLRRARRGTLHMSGMVAFGSDGSYVGIGDVHAQAVQVFENLAAVVEAAGGTLDDVVSTTTYLAAAEHATTVGSVRKRYFTAPVPPTSTVVVAPMARSQFLVEIAAIAHIPEQPTA